MRLSSEFRVLGSLLLLLLLAGTVLADSKDETLRPVSNEPVEAADEPSEGELRRELEAEYRAELQERLAQERESYAGSLTSLWLSNAAVWTVLIAFIIAQSVTARRRANELARLKAMREEPH